MTADVLHEEQEAELDEALYVTAETDTETKPEPETEPLRESNAPDTGTEGKEDATKDEAADAGDDYAALAASDLKELKGEFPELAGLEHISGLDNPLRYAALRDLGLSPREAYLATAKRQRADGRAHLSSAMPKSAGSPGGGMSPRQLAEAREIFSDMSDVEIRALYKKVTR